jgi:hypothetical protein
MIIHSPVISGSLTFADGATFTLPDNGIYSGSFSGSFQGDGSSLTFGGTNIVSSSEQLSLDFLDTLGDGVVSGSSQIEFNDINNNPFTQGASSVGVSKSIIPDSLTLDLGSSAYPFRDLYLSSASLYVNGTQVISSTNDDLTITTDENQSLKLVETGADTITLQTANGDITLTSTGAGNIELDAPIQIAAGNQILSSDGNAIQFGEDISVTGNITVTGTVDTVDVAQLRTDVDAILSGSSADKDSFAEIVTLINSVDTGNDEAFAAHYTSSRQRLDSIEGFTSSIDTTIKTKLTAEDVVSGSASQVRSFLNVEDGADNSPSLSIAAQITEGTPIGYISLSGTKNHEIALSQVNAAHEISNLTTDYVSEGSGSLYYTDSRVLTYLNGLGVQSGSDTPHYSDSDNLVYLNSLGVVSSSAQITITESQISDLTHYTDSDTKSKLNADSVISGSSQVVLESADKTGFTGASSITTLGTIGTGVWQGSIIDSQYLDADPLPAGTISGSSQVDLTQTTNYISGIKSRLTAENVISSSAQITITESQISDLDHYTDTDFDNRLATKTTSNLTEGSNLYYTDARVKTKLNADEVISGSAQIAPFFDPTLTINGDASGTATFTNLGDATLTLTIADDSHNHTIANVDGLQTALDGKVATNSVQALNNGTALSLSTNTLTLTKADGTTDTVDLSAYLDEDARAIASGTLNGVTGIVTFTRDDSTTFTLDLSDLLDDTNLVTSVNGRNGVVVTALSDYGITATSAEINKLDGVTATTAELNYVDGVTSNIQTQLDGKLGTGGKAADSELLDGLDSTAFLRSNATDSASGVITFSNSTASTSTTTGAVKITGGLGVGGDVYVGGDVVAYASSDERLKKNIEIISKPIQKVQALKGVTWVWKDEASEAQKDTPALGVIAQDVEKVLPQLVDTRENGYKAVDYGKLTGLLIEAIKDQQKQIDELKSRLQ